jgi:multiple sugar transport system ATP-binding protein
VFELERDDISTLSGAGVNEVTVGIRPEQLEVTDTGGVEVVVDLVEDLGSEAYVYTHAAGSDSTGVELVARCNPRTAPRLADTVRLRRHPDGAVHLFHPETGERLN